MPWSVDTAVKKLQDQASGSSTGMCAKFVRIAIEAGGVTLTRHNSAKDYGPSLTSVGFTELNFCPATYQKGDVAVIQSIPGHPHGHMQMYDGGQWISDFKQTDFWPGSAYRTKQPDYEIYRYPTGALPDLGVCPVP